MKRLGHSTQTATRIAFGVVIAFVLAQVLWWIIFQYHYIQGVTADTLAAWQQQATLASNLLARAPTDTGLIDELHAAHPNLVLQGERFVPDPEAVQAFTRRQRGYIRMVAFEGPFFVLVVLSGLMIIAASLRTERGLKRRQQNFLSAITHEFRTPIGTLRLLIETALYRKPDPEKTRSYLQRMERELARLEATSEQVLASARLEQAESPPALEPVDLAGVVGKLLGELRPGLEARGARLMVELGTQPLPVSLDPSAFGIVLSNLLDNAVKYSEGPEKPVRVRLEAADHLVLLHVEDEGAGVAETEIRHLFDRFYRVGSEMTRESTGVGLGLYLVKSITEAMNGWVRCESLERGTRFSVVLPRRVQSEPQGLGQLERMT
ncbi:MAG TPA: HAMP domain-containing sensor histidine kinase [Trueperaceae bacterium]